MTSGRIQFLDLATTHGEVRAELDEAWDRAVSSSGFIGGAAVEQFENEFAEYCDTAHAIGVANGTDALELILEGLGIGAGDEVIVPANTFIATAEAVVRVGAVPVFVDVDPATALLTGDAVRAALTERTAAVMAVHLYGQMVDMGDLLAVTEPAGVVVIEDAAQAHGATYRGRRAGSFGVAAGFSFYPGKNLGALGDGGAVVTDDAELTRRIRCIANHGRAGGHYLHSEVGRNSRLDALQAAALSVKLPHLDRWNEQRRVVAATYRDGLPAEFLPFAQRCDGAGVHHLFVVAGDVPRDVVTEALDRAGIGWGVHYPVPCHLNEPFAPDGRPRPGSLPVSEALAGRQVSLPMHPHLSTADVERVCDVLRCVVGG